MHYVFTRDGGGMTDGEGVTRETLIRTTGARWPNGKNTHRWRARWGRVFEYPSVVAAIRRDGGDGDTAWLRRRRRRGGTATTIYAAFVCAGARTLTTLTHTNTRGRKNALADTRTRCWRRWRWRRRRGHTPGGPRFRRELPYVPAVAASVPGGGGGSD